MAQAITTPSLYISSYVIQVAVKLLILFQLPDTFSGGWDIRYSNTLVQKEGGIAACTISKGLSQVSSCLIGTGINTIGKRSREIIHTPYWVPYNCYSLTMTGIKYSPQCWRRRGARGYFIFHFGIIFTFPAYWFGTGVHLNYIGGLMRNGGGWV